MKTLTLPLKGVYFDQIKSGEKKFEFRLMSEYWAKRLVDRSYDRIVLTKGYPKKSDVERRIIRPWRGWEHQCIQHEHFGEGFTDVFAIRVN